MQQLESHDGTGTMTDEDANKDNNEPAKTADKDKVVVNDVKKVATTPEKKVEVKAIAKKAAERNYSVTVLVPQFVPKKPWQNILHNQTALRLRTALNSRENIIVSTYNYHLKK